MVEDQPDDVFFFQSAAKKAGVQQKIEVACDGQQAIDALKKTAAPGEPSRLPCLVLLDLKLPYVSGLEVLEWIRKQPRLTTVPVVILSSSEQEEDIEAAYRLGASGYLTKPSQPTDLAGMVRAIDEFWLKRNRRPLPVVHGARAELLASPG